ncbi:MAG TPA: ABC transporter permease [Hyphomicrobiaceae bacterium]|nr:ABC transporter permease [Hyphomicrobiaceae bacterium]
MGEGRPRSFYWLAALFALFVLFLWGPVLTILLLSFQGPDGGLTFPMNGISTHWFNKLWHDGLPNVDIWSAFARSVRLGVVVMVLTVVLSLLAGLAYRKRFRGADQLLFVVIASLIMPSIVVSLGIGLEFRILDDAVKRYAPAALADGYDTAMGLFTSALGAHLTWTLPFGLLIMFAIFNRFDPRYEEAARDLGATPWQALRHVVLPIIGPSVVGIGLFGFTLSWDEIARTSQAVGYLNTLPLELQGQTTTVTTPVIYALGTLTTAVSLLMIAVALGAILMLRRRQPLASVGAGT